jgi:hypothetical protein
MALSTLIRQHLSEFDQILLEESRRAYCGRLGHLYIGSVCIARTFRAVAPYGNLPKMKITIQKLAFNVHPDCNSQPIVQII